MGKLQHDVMEYAASHADVHQVHAFFYYEDSNLITIDVVPEESVKDNGQFAAMMEADLRRRFPKYNFSIIVDHNYSE